MLILRGHSWLPNPLFTQMAIVARIVSSRYDITDTVVAVSETSYAVMFLDKCEGYLTHSKPPLTIDQIIDFNILEDQEFSIFPMTKARDEEIKSIAQVVGIHDDYYTIKYHGRLVNVFTEGLLYKHSRGKYIDGVSLN